MSMNHQNRNSSILNSLDLKSRSCTEGPNPLELSGGILVIGGWPMRQPCIFYVIFLARVPNSNLVIRSGCKIGPDHVRPNEARGVTKDFSSQSLKLCKP